MKNRTAHNGDIHLFYRRDFSSGCSFGFGGRLPGLRLPGGRFDSALWAAPSRYLHAGEIGVKRDDFGEDSLRFRGLAQFG